MRMKTLDDGIQLDFDATGAIAAYSPHGYYFAKSGRHTIGYAGNSLQGAIKALKEDGGLARCPAGCNGDEHIPTESENEMAIDREQGRRMELSYSIIKEQAVNESENEMTTEQNGQALVVTTQHRGVFFGYGTPTAESTIELSRARMCLYWPEENHGVVGLAADGPKTGARIGPAAPKIMLRDVTAVMECSPEAVAAWESEPWS